MRRMFPMIVLAIAAGTALYAQQHLADLPDPLVGTDSRYELSRGNTYPAVFMPFGMANWTPQTGEGGWPYQYSATSIRGFRSTHRPSAWMTDYGPIALMPVTGALKLLPAERASKFRHENETSKVYRYSVLLDDSGVKAEMAPAQHCGIMRFTFPRTEQAYIVLDAQPGGSSVRIEPETRTIRAKNSFTSKGTAPNFAVYYVLVFDRPFTSRGTWDGKGARDSALERTGPHVGAYAGFSTGDQEPITVRIGTSLISYEQAERNLKSEIPESNLDTVADRARAEWDRELSRTAIQGGTPEQRATFYTAMAHTVQFPRMLNETDAGGAMVHYSPYDGRVHPGPMISDTGFWDTFRAEFPLLTVLAPKRDAEIMKALVNVYDEAGWMPKWPNPAETNVMIGTHADSVVADAYIKGIRDFDIQKAYAAIRKDGTEPGTGIFKARPGIADYLRIGYVPADKVPESAASTLEYAYDDFCIAQVANGLGKRDDYQRFMAQSKNYRNLFDASTGFMRGRNSDGKWVEPFDPLDWGGVFTEGNAWQWLWSVQHDVPGLMKLLGGTEGFIRKLDELFSTTNEFRVGGYKKVIHEMTEAKLANMGQYAHINEPVHHVIYLYDYAGQPWKTQKWVRAVIDQLYKPGPAGWLGDEDNGQMSAWYVFSALGFYPVNPGQPVYALGTPLFDRATIRLENGKSFTVEASRRAASDLYVQSVMLNGRVLTRPWITHAEIMNGGVLSFRLGRTPNENWGTSGLPVPE